MLAYALTPPKSEKVGLMRIAQLQREINAGNATEGILQVLVTSTLKSLHPTYAFIVESHPEGYFTLVSDFGAEEDIAQTLAEIHPNSDHPLSLAIQTAHLVCIASDPQAHSHEKSTAYQPLIYKGSHPQVLVIGFSEPLNDEQNLMIIFEVISQMLVNHLHRSFYTHEAANDDATIDTSRESSLTEINLSERQLKIAEMIADGMTNRQISRQLGYTEATIRYETIKLYERLRVRNRAQASSRIRELISK